MKYLLTLIIAFTMVSCGIREFYSVTVINESSKTVSYVYNGQSDTIGLSDSKSYSVKAYTQPPKNVVDQNDVASLNINQKDNVFTFIDATPFKLNVVNKLPITVIIKADKYIDDNGSVEFLIDENTEKTTAKIFTSKPKFMSLVDYPVIIDWNFNEDTVYVIIR